MSGSPAGVGHAAPGGKHEMKLTVLAVPHEGEPIFLPPVP